jgi:glycosyltransferase involved in cell wall biosynthesis
MRVLGFYRHAWPVQRGGSEVAAHRVLSWLADRGHDVSAVVTHQRGIPTDGVEYIYGDRRGVMNSWRDADVVITHQSASREAIELSGQYGPPVLHWSHNWMWFDAVRDALRPDVDVVAWNTEVLADHMNGKWAGRSLVLHPPTFPDRYQPCAGEFVTQVNLNALKGGEMFWQIAREMPDTQFLAVVGGWMEQIDANGVAHHPKHSVAPIAASALPNVTVVGTTEDMFNDVWARTRILIVPTQRINDQQVGESWGLVAAEAASCGIPVIATASPGMEELLSAGDAGVLVDQFDDLDAWTSAIAEVEDNWELESTAMLERSKAFDPTDELELLERTLLEMVG